MYQAKTSVGLRFQNILNQVYDENNKATTLTLAADIYRETVGKPDAWTEIYIIARTQCLISDANAKMLASEIVP